MEEEPSAEADMQDSNYRRMVIEHRWLLTLDQFAVRKR